MTYDEIEASLKNAGCNSVIERLRVAVGEEADALLDAGSARGTTLDQRVIRAREYYAESITTWLDSSASPEPEALLGHRARYATSWAFAQIIERYQTEATEAEDADEDPVPVEDGALLAICEANSQLSLLLVELMRKVQEQMENVVHGIAVSRIRDALDAAEVVNMNRLGNRKLDVWERVELLLVENAEAQALFAEVKPNIASIVEGADNIQQLAQSLIWAAETVHNGHHKEHLVTDGRTLGWRGCSKGICGSMEHMLAQAGLDKHLKPIGKRP